MEIKISEISKLVKSRGYSNIRLVNSNNKVCCAFNNLKHPMEKKLEEIIGDLNSDFLPAGTYFLECKKTPGARIAHDRFTIIKSTGAIEPEQRPQIMEAKKAREKFETITEREALEAMIENGILISENEQLRKDLEDAEASLKEYEDQAKQLASGPEAILEKWLPIIQQLGPVVTPIIQSLLNGLSNANPLNAVPQPGANVANGNGHLRPQSYGPVNTRPQDVSNHGPGYNGDPSELETGQNG